MLFTQPNIINNTLSQWLYSAHGTPSIWYRKKQQPQNKTSARKYLGYSLEAHFHKSLWHGLTQSSQMCQWWSCRVILRYCLWLLCVHDLNIIYRVILRIISSHCHWSTLSQVHSPYLSNSQQTCPFCPILWTNQRFVVHSCIHKHKSVVFEPDNWW